ncbi:threonine synthase [Paenibacillus sp. TRM 82003]|nr:threonine synthase [Paenibacillus sp. TRM 82003]
MSIEIRCDSCGASKQTEATQCTCGGVWEIQRNISAVDGELLRRRFDERLALRSGVYASGVWRYHELVAPELPLEALVTRGEGNTGLYESDALTIFAGVRKLWFKAQSENPSGSFKDNGMVVAVSHGRSLGKRTFTCTSTGNTSSSLAMYAAWIGGRSLVLTPGSGIAPAKIAQTLAYGATVIPFEGTYDDGIRFLDAHAATLGLYVCNSINPYRLEGQKSIVFELAQQLCWHLPDWIALPGGALSNVSALGKGLEDLLALGFIDKLPRIALVQAEGASPFHRMIARGLTSLTSEPYPWTRASALNIGNPPNWRKARTALQRTNGATVAVTDERILSTKRMIDQSGIGCEPASAAALAGVIELREQGIIRRDETVACILTGHLLKDVEAVTEAVNIPSNIGLLTVQRIAEALMIDR